jgi:hypothetical protein
MGLIGVGVSAGQVMIDHRWSNSDAQSLIGLPMGSHKTIVDQQGYLKWSQWSLKRRPLDSAPGFSIQMDGELAVRAEVESKLLKVTHQELYRGRYPFIVSTAEAGGVVLEELAFAADPDATPGELPNAQSGKHGVDLVRMLFRNKGESAVSAILRLSGRERNLPGHVQGMALITHSGEDVALVKDGADAEASSTDQGLTLSLRLQIPAHGEKTLWIELPYEYPAEREGELTRKSGEELLTGAIAQWDGLWARSMRMEFPQQELNDFYLSSLAYLLILTEYDAQSDLWTLDGPSGYREYWGRGEYFQSRAMEVAGLFDPARQSVEHAFRLMNDDGEWDFPAIAGWPAWDNSGGNAGAVWNYYLFSRDRQWLERAYPALLANARWIRDHREESTLEGVKNLPEGARPIRRMITFECSPEPEPTLQPGEKSYWYGLLPWSFGDSGLPEGHSFSHNYLAAYAVKVAADAARLLDHNQDAAWLDEEYAAYTADIRESVRRAVTLEKTTPAYLPAMPTYPQGAYSQSFLAVYPTGIYAPNDPLVSGLLQRMESEEQQGLPTNVAWAGLAGVWAGEAMNMAETYLLRGEKQKAANMLVAALNHSYTTKVWKEEILVDINQPRACDFDHKKRANMEGTGDMPEAWANANLILFLRDALINEREGALHLLAGLPEAWLPARKTLLVENAPVTTGGVVSLQVQHVDEQHWKMTIDVRQSTANMVLHLPIDDASRIVKVRVNGKAVPVAAAIPVAPGFAPSTVEVETR